MTRSDRAFPRDPARWENPPGSSPSSAVGLMDAAVGAAAAATRAGQDLASSLVGEISKLPDLEQWLLDAVRRAVAALTTDAPDDDADAPGPAPRADPSARVSGILEAQLVTLLAHRLNDVGVGLGLRAWGGVGEMQEHAIATRLTGGEVEELDAYRALWRLPDDALIAPFAAPLSAWEEDTVARMSAPPPALADVIPMRPSPWDAEMVAAAPMMSADVAAAPRGNSLSAWGGGS